MTNKRKDIEAELEYAIELLGAYRKAVNRIDDMFEYSNESKSDRDRVYKILEELAEDLWRCL